MNYGMGGYQQAYDHYKKLKENFFERLGMEATIENEKLFSSRKVDFPQKILKNWEQYGKKDLSDQMYKQAQIIFQKFIAEINNNPEFNNALEQAYIAMENEEVKLQQEAKKSADKAHEYAIKFFNKQISENISKEMQPQTILTSVLSKMYGITQNQTLENFDALIKKANQFVRIYFQALQKRQELETIKLFGKPLSGSAGFINEFLSHKSLEQLFKLAKVNKAPKVRAGGTKKFDGQMIEMDNIIQFVGGFNSLNQQLEVTYNLDNFLNENYEKHMKKIRFFGEQAKTFKINNLSGIKYIAQRKELFNKAKEEYNGYLSLEQNREFMSKYRSILEVFRPDTLFFSGSDIRMFMSDFISHFRNQGYYLQFLVSQEKDNNNGQVVLDNSQI